MCNSWTFNFCEREIEVFGNKLIELQLFLNPCQIVKMLDNLNKCNVTKYN